MPLVIAGATSGSTTVQATDAVTATITLPSATGTVQLTGGAVSATTGIFSGAVQVGTATSANGNQLNVTAAGGSPTAVAAAFAIHSNDVIAANTGGAMSFGGLYSGTNATEWAGIAGLKDDATSGNYGGYMAFYSRPNGAGFSERMRLPSAGGIQSVNCVSVGNATPSTSGAGITFPATQSASTDANTLDDYEEGTWTPNQGSGLTVVGAFSSTGTYTKVGRVVTVCFRVGGVASVALAAQSIVCTNLPFTNLDSSNVFGYGTGSNNAGSISTTFQAATTTVYSTTVIAATAYIFVSITYFSS